MYPKIIMNTEQYIVEEVYLRTMLETTTKFPERNLLVAMIERALLDYFGNQAVERTEAADWLFSDESSEEPFSFQWVCGQLDLSPVDVTAQLKKIKPRGELRPQQWWGMRRRA